MRLAGEIHKHQCISGPRTHQTYPRSRDWPRPVYQNPPGGQAWGKWSQSVGSPRYQSGADLPARLMVTENAPPPFMIFQQKKHDVTALASSSLGSVHGCQALSGSPALPFARAPAPPPPFISPSPDGSLKQPGGEAWP